jgi:hypothetical protein
MKMDGDACGTPGTRCVEPYASPLKVLPMDDGQK